MRGFGVERRCRSHRVPALKPLVEVDRPSDFRCGNERTIVPVHIRDQLHTTGRVVEDHGGVPRVRRGIELDRREVGDGFSRAEVEVGRPRRGSAPRASARIRKDREVAARVEPATVTFMTRAIGPDAIASTHSPPGPSGHGARYGEQLELVRESMMREGATPTNALPPYVLPPP